MTCLRKDLLTKARTLRREMTKEERHLWYDFLCQYPVRFRRQRPMLEYIVDFYCPKVQLGVELDGEQHASGSQLEYDMERTHRLSKMGIFILRFTNREVWQNFSGVCQAIDQTVKDRLCSQLPEGHVHI